VRKFADAFVRNADGSWFCRAPAEFVAPNGVRTSVTPGATYRLGKPLNGVDVAKWLDEWDTHGVKPPGVEFV
jgi:hypothetical protein